MYSLRKNLYYLLVLTIVLAIFSVFIDFSFELKYKNIQSSKNLQDIREATVVIVPGAAVYGNKPSPILKDRLRSAVLLYKSKKVKKVLLSGDASRSYNELKPMIQYMIKNDVPKEDIFVDFHGYRTLETMKNAKYKFQIKDAIIATQRFHQPRATYLAQKMGIQVSAYESDLQVYQDDLKNRVREFFARNLAWFDIQLLDIDVNNGAGTISILGNGRQTWDKEYKIKK